MTKSIKLTSHEPQSSKPRPVRVSFTTEPDGRIVVVVKVRAAADVDLPEGVFLDLVHATTERAERRPRRAAPAFGLVVAPVPVAANDAPAHATVRPASRSPLTAKAAPVRKHRAIRSQVIAPAQHLIGGRIETFRSEIALPPKSVAGWSWFVRGRCGAGEDLRSKWVRVT